MISPTYRLSIAMIVSSEAGRKKARWAFLRPLSLVDSQILRHTHVRLKTQLDIRHRV
jgi:hypothetical protein